MSDGALHIEGLTVSYATGGARLTALDDVSFTVPRGSRVAIVGESGSGKSTLGLALMGLLPDNARLTARTVRVGGSEVDLGGELTGYRGAEVAMVFQDAKAALDPVRTVGFQIGQAVTLGGPMRAPAVRDRVTGLLEEVELDNPAMRARQYPHELSGGMRQRAMIAAALAGEPAVVVADEPTSALDVTTQQTVLDLLQRLSVESSVSTLLITHDLALVAGFAERVMVLYAGKLVEYGPVDQIFGDPAHPYTRALLAAIPSLAGARSARLGSIPGGLPDLTLEHAGCVFVDRCARSQGRGVCRETTPVLTLAGGGTDVACHFADERTEVGLGDQAAAEPVVAASSGATDQEPLVRLSQVTKSFRRRSLLRSRDDLTVALDRVDLEVRPGESLGVVGESGSGKTTIARIIAGLERADSGEVWIDGRQRHGRAGRRGPDQGFVQMIFQDPGDSLNPLMSVGSIIAEPLVLRDGGRPSGYRDQVARLLLDVGLQPDMAQRRPAQLSGGQRQRVATARALSTQPRLIIADEAVASLDMSARGQMLNLLADLQAQFGFAYLHISHDLSMVRHVCSRVVVMHGGHVVETGTTDAIFGAPTQEYTRRLLAAVPIPDPEIERRRLGGEREDRLRRAHT